MGLITDSKTVGKLKAEISRLRWLVRIVYIIFLLDCIIVHGCIRDEQQEAIKSAAVVVRILEEKKQHDEEQSQEREVSKEQICECEYVLPDHKHRYYDGMVWQE